jgi:hypothetical protein
LKLGLLAYPSDPVAHKDAVLVVEVCTFGRFCSGAFHGIAVQRMGQRQIALAIGG